MSSDAEVPFAPSGALTVHFEVGDGLAADWQLSLVTAGARARRWEGSTDDRLPDTVDLAAGALREGDTLAWAVLLYGPAQAHPYHVRVRVTQAGRDLCDPAVRLVGELKARKAQQLGGTLTLRAAS